jgi:hypothetical protein
MLNRYLSVFTQSPSGYLWEGEATPAGGETPAAPVAATTATPAAPATATPPADATLTPARTGTPEGMVPSYRLREAREAATRQANEQFATREAELRAEMARYRQQVEALTGISAPKNTEADQIKQQFFQLFPWAKKLEERFGDFEQVVDRAGDLEAQNQHYWEVHGRQTMDNLYKHAEDSLGTPLTDEGKRLLHTSFIGFVQQSPEMQNRYAQDPSIVNDFWKAYTSTFIDPARRGSSAAVAGRAAGAASLPQDTPGSGAPPVGGPPAFKNLDERVAAGWEQFKLTKK